MNDTNALAGTQVIAAYRVTNGAQVYECQSGEFSFKEPDATLAEVSGSGRTMRHFAGPTWLSDDGSQVVGRKLAESPVPDAVPELLLKVVSHSGSDGDLSTVTHIQRLFTSGGLPPERPCADGETVRSPYQAEYRFLAP